jgi:MFS family permease
MSTLTERRRSSAVPFAAIAAVLVTFMAASAAPSPLYVVYQREWGFSTGLLTAIFAIYVASLTGTLLVFGSLSDHLGRRPVLVSAIALEAVAMVLFLTAGNVTVLLAARLLQGIATGAALATLGATLIDLNPPHAPGRAGLVNSIVPGIGLSAGALGCGALVQYAPLPTHLVYALLLLGMIAAGIVVARLPETSVRRPGWRASLRPRLGVPARLRPEVLALSPIIVASWALCGLYLSLGPSVAVSELGLGSHLIGGFLIALFCGTGVVASLVLRRTSTPRALLVAGSFLLLGTLTGLLGVELGAAALAGAGTVIAGIGFGAAALASIGTLSALAGPAERGELFAVVLVIGYTAFSIPAVLAGVATNAVGLHVTAVIYGLVVALFAAAALIARRVRVSW